MILGLLFSGPMRVLWVVFRAELADRLAVLRLSCAHTRSRLIASGWAVLGYEPTATVTAHRRRGAAGWFGQPAAVGSASLPIQAGAPPHGLP